MSFLAFLEIASTSESAHPSGSREQLEMIELSWSRHIPAFSTAERAERSGLLLIEVSLCRSLYQ